MSNNLKDYDYPLNEQAIAIHPPEIRGNTKLLVLNKNTGQLIDSMYSQLYKFLKPNDLVILNNTKVIKARLIAKTESSKLRELLILEKHGKDQNKHLFKVMYRGKIRPKQILKIGSIELIVSSVNDDGTAVIESNEDVYKLAELYGNVPLPPYLHRQAEDKDNERYQTLFAKNSGSVAAPTASLNMTNELVSKLKDSGVSIAEITLHVGLGTFMPIRTDAIKDHKMHQEYFEIPLITINAIKKAKKLGGRIVAVGTTVTRAIEYASKQILEVGTEDINGEADIFIYPGYKFKIVDCMVTNFHAPKSTVLMMASAFSGWDNLKNAYTHALVNEYKFLSYGDSMLLI